MKRRSILYNIAIFFFVFMLITGCYRGRPSKKPPIHIIPDMDSQPRYETQEKNEFFEDDLAMRHPVAGTIAVGKLQNSPDYFTGKDARDRFISENPVEINMPLLQRGRDRYDVYCAPCHSRVGDGKGIMTNYGYIPPPTFHSERLRGIENGYLFDVISNGVRTMPAYSHQISVNDRWAIVAYVRALQRSQNASIQDVPEEKRDQLTKQ